MVDYDRDGFLDIVYPNYITKKVEYLRNPGGNSSEMYWHKIYAVTQSGNK